MGFSKECNIPTIMLLTFWHWRDSDIDHVNETMQTIGILNEFDEF